MKIRIARFGVCTLIVFCLEPVSNKISTLRLKFCFVPAQPSEDVQTTRNGRQIVLRQSGYQQYNPFLVSNNVNTIPLATAGPCFTGKGVLGKCTSFRQCYPYFKVPELNNFESWILGMYDTCSYYTAQGRQVRRLFLLE
jgi:hypothetical protein